MIIGRTKTNANAVLRRRQLSNKRHEGGEPKIDLNRRQYKTVGMYNSRQAFLLRDAPL
jgi:hypothetical protein